MLPLREMSRSMAIHQQGSVSGSRPCITTREDGNISGQPPGTMWMSRGCAQLPLPLTGFSALESKSYLSQVIALGIVGPVPSPGSTMELSFGRGMGEMSRGHECRRAYSATHLPWDGNRHKGDPCPTPPLTTFGSQEKLPQGHEFKSPSPATALGRVGAYVP